MTNIDEVGVGNTELEIVTTDDVKNAFGANNSENENDHKTSHKQPEVKLQTTLEMTIQNTLSNATAISDKQSEVLQTAHSTLRKMSTTSKPLLARETTDYLVTARKYSSKYDDMGETVTDLIADYSLSFRDETLEQSFQITMFIRRAHDTRFAISVILVLQIVYAALYIRNYQRGHEIYIPVTYVTCTVAAGLFLLSLFVELNLDWEEMAAKEQEIKKKRKMQSELEQQRLQNRIEDETVDAAVVTGDNILETIRTDVELKILTAQDDLQLRMHEFTELQHQNCSLFISTSILYSLALFNHMLYACLTQIGPSKVDIKRITIFFVLVNSFVTTFGFLRFYHYVIFVFLTKAVYLGLLYHYMFVKSVDSGTATIDWFGFNLVMIISYVLTGKYLYLYEYHERALFHAFVTEDALQLQNNETIALAEAVLSGVKGLHSADASQDMRAKEFEQEKSHSSGSALQRPNQIGAASSTGIQLTDPNGIIFQLSSKPGFRQRHTIRNLHHAHPEQTSSTVRTFVSTRALFDNNTERRHAAEDGDLFQTAADYFKGGTLAPEVLFAKQSHSALESVWKGFADAFSHSARKHHRAGYKSRLKRSKSHKKLNIPMQSTENHLLSDARTSQPSTQKVTTVDFVGVTNTKPKAEQMTSTDVFIEEIGAPITTGLTVRHEESLDLTSDADFFDDAEHKQREDERERKETERENARNARNAGGTGDSDEDDENIERDAGLYSLYDLPEWYSPYDYVLHGYRLGYDHKRTCLEAGLCNVNQNEFMNLFTNAFFTVLYFVIWMYFIVSEPYFYREQSNWSKFFVCIPMGFGIFLGVCSFIAHMFHTVSKKWVRRSWNVDFIGIIATTMSVASLQIHLMFYCTPQIQYMFLFMGLLLAMTALLTALRTLDDSIRESVLGLLIVMSFVLLPVGHWVQLAMPASSTTSPPEYSVLLGVCIATLATQMVVKSLGYPEKYFVARELKALYGVDILDKDSEIDEYAWVDMMRTVSNKLKGHWTFNLLSSHSIWHILTHVILQVYFFAFARYLIYRAKRGCDGQ